MAAVGEFTSSLPAEQKRLSLTAVVESETFARCDQLRSFLTYVGEMAIAGRSREITEYLIAVQALGRPADFSPSEDSSVRSRAHELRRKLQKYYETEDPGAKVRIELPKGSYVPRFLPQDHPEQVISPEILPAHQPLPHDRSRLAARLAVALCVTLAISGGLAWQLIRITPAAVDPATAEAWGPLARRDANVLVCVGTVLHLVVRPYMSAVAEGLPKYSAPQELYPLYRQHRPLPPDTPLDMHPVDNSVQLGHMSAVVMLAGAFQTLGASYQILPERSAPVTVMRDRNVIIIGDPQNSSAAAKMLEETPFTVDYDAQLQDLVIRDRRPASTRKIYAPKRGPDNRYTDAYGLVTVTPTAGAKRGQRTVTISGLTSVGSHGAAEFFTSAAELRAMRERFKREGLAGFPGAYQVVVKCKSSDTLLISAEYETHATIKN